MTDEATEAFFADHALGRAIHQRVHAILAEAGAVDVRVTRSQIAYRRRRGFAYLWLPERTLGPRAAGIVVLSIALGRHDPSSRFKEVVKVSPHHWMHHVELRDPADVDAQVAAWLLEAAARAG